MQRILLLLLVVQSLISCGEKANSSNDSEVQEDSLLKLKSAEGKLKVHTSQNSLDWVGSYSGVLPCENCDGIEVTLVLNKDETFQQKLRYLNSSEETDKIYGGSFTWSEEGDKIKLEGGEGISEFKVGVLFLLPLDEDGKEIKPVPGNNFQLLKE